MAYISPALNNPLRPMVFVLGSLANGTVIYSLNDCSKDKDGREVHGAGKIFQRDSQLDVAKSNLMRNILNELKKVRGNKLIALDCGANIGIHTIAMAQILYPEGKVIAYEPQEWIYYCLCGNLALNNLHNATATRMAIGNIDGQLKFKTPNPLLAASFGSFGFDHIYNYDVGQSNDQMIEAEVPMRSLDNLGLERVDFIKIDIESLEIACIEGGKKLIQKNKPILLIEFLKGDLQLLIERLGEYGYKFMRYSNEADIIAWHQEDTASEAIIKKFVTEEPLNISANSIARSQAIKQMRIGKEAIIAPVK